MGICASSEHLGQQGQDADESIVYVMDEEGGGGASSPRKVASLFSQKGKKGPNQDAVILCQVVVISTPPLALSGIYFLVLDLDWV
uniref:Predicted protein n=1 Tax=Hordeum vulgare subsp. vulgare TaxID=112509 RepID=F2E5M6_HORVV|nr:predicted protein [Hordeum vulgare subsp. vulgare]